MHLWLSELSGRALSTPLSRYHEQIRNVRNIFLIKFKCMCPKRSSNILTISGSSNFPIAIFRAQLSLYVHIYIHTYVRCIYLHYNKAVILLLCHTEHMNLKSQEETAVKIFESFPVRTADGRQMHTRGLQVQPSPAEEKCSSEVCVSKCTAALLLSAQTASAQGILAHYHPMKHEKGWDCSKEQQFCGRGSCLQAASTELNGLAWKWHRTDGRKVLQVGFSSENSSVQMAQSRFFHSWLWIFCVAQRGFHEEWEYPLGISPSQLPQRRISQVLTSQTCSQNSFPALWEALRPYLDMLHLHTATQWRKSSTRQLPITWTGLFFFTYSSCIFLNISDLDR